MKKKKKRKEPISSANEKLENPQEATSIPNEEVGKVLRSRRVSRMRKGRENFRGDAAQTNIPNRRKVRKKCCGDDDFREWGWEGKITEETTRVSRKGRREKSRESDVELSLTFLSEYRFRAAATQCVLATGTGATHGSLEMRRSQ